MFIVKHEDGASFFQDESDAKNFYMKKQVLGANAKVYRVSLNEISCFEGFNGYDCLNDRTNGRVEHYIIHSDAKRNGAE